MKWVPWTEDQAETRWDLVDDDAPSTGWLCALTNDFNSYAALYRGDDGGWTYAVLGDGVNAWKPTPDLPFDELKEWATAIAGLEGKL